MAKKTQPSPVSSLLVPGARVLHEGRSLTVSVAEPVVDPRGGVYLDSPTREWYVGFTDGSRTLVTGSLEAA